MTVEIFDPATGEIITEPLSGERMAELYYVAIRQADRFRDMAAKLELDMLQYMEANNATAIPHTKFDIGINQRPMYDKTRFTPLKEVFNKADLDKCYTPATSRMERVEYAESWDTQQVNAAAKRYGKQALDIVEASKTMGAKRIKFSVIVDN